MVIIFRQGPYGLWVARNEYYNDCRWLCVTDDYGNLVKINTARAQVSLS